MFTVEYPSSLEWAVAEGFKNLLGALSGSLIVSCQPVPGGPFDDPELVVRFVEAAELGGARAVRVEGLNNVEAVCRSTTLPVIGLVKRATPGSDVYITPSLADIESLAARGVRIVAFDATDRQRAHPVGEMVARIHDLNCLAMADVATTREGVAAHGHGAELVGTTLSGYTDSSPRGHEPDLELVSSLAREGVRVVAEGRIATPAQAARALQNGAFAVTVGTAITRPEWTTRGFARALSESSSPARQEEETR